MALGRTFDFRSLLAGCALVSLALMAPVPASATIYVQQNLVSDEPGVAAHQDANLVNAWGLARSATSPWWVGDNGTGLSTVYNATGVASATVVTIPPVPSAPTGVVSNPGAGFVLPVGGAKASFLFATEEGTIAAWNGGQGTTAVTMATTAGANYKGLAIGSTGDFLYAANFASGHVDVFNSSFAPTSLGASSFTDPTLPAEYHPFGIQNIGGNIYVTYAKVPVGGGGDEEDGPGLGFVSVFDANGNFLGRVASAGTLNAPWGLALAPANFGDFSNDLLVGNFGDGRISAFNATTFAFVGQLNNALGPIEIDGLWAIMFGGGAANNGATSALYFTAGPGGEDHGLFGALVVAPEPSTLAIFGAGLLGAFRLRRRRALI